MTHTLIRQEEFPIPHDVALTLLQQSRRMNVDERIYEEPLVATIMENHSIMSGSSANDSYCFEIKPKWGFLPHGSTTYDVIHSKKKNRCRFHMHSYYRKNQSVDEYCPLDLFSQDVCRVERAIKALMQIPESNQWKIFVNSRKIAHKEHNNVLSSVIGEAWAEILPRVLAKILLHDGILSNIKRHQQRLDGNGGIAGLKEAIDSSVLWKWEELDSCLDLPAVDFAEFIQEYLCGDLKTSKDLLKQHILQHLVSMTLKDCSVMVTLTLTNPTLPLSSSNLDDTVQPDTICSTGTAFFNGSVYRYQIRLVDLDLKMPKFGYWFEIDEKIRITYSATSSKRECFE